MNEVQKNTLDAMRDRKAILADAFADLGLAARLLHEHYGPPKTPWDTPPSYTRLQQALCVGMLLRSIPDPDITRYLLGNDTLHKPNPFPAKKVRSDGDTHHATFADGTTYSYEVIPHESFLVTHNAVSITIPDHIDADLQRVNLPFSRDQLYSGKTTFTFPEAYLAPSRNNTPLQLLRNYERAFTVHRIIGKSIETIIQLPTKDPNACTREDRHS